VEGEIVTARLPALEAVAAAARALVANVRGFDAVRLEVMPGDAASLEAALARLDATPAAQSPTPTPTDEELRALRFDVSDDNQFDAIHDAWLKEHQGRTLAVFADDMSNRAIWDACRAACVARLRAAKATAVRYEALKVRDAKLGRETPGGMPTLDVECVIEAIARRLEAADTIESEARGGR
jgi:hypothetical protein